MIWIIITAFYESDLGLILHSIIAIAYNTVMLPFPQSPNMMGTALARFSSGKSY